MEKNFIEVKSDPITPTNKIINEVRSGKIDKSDYGIYDGIEVKFRVWIDNNLFEFNIDFYGIHLVEFNLNRWKYSYDLVSIILNEIYKWSYKKTLDKLTIEYCKKQESILKNRLYLALKDKEFIKTEHPCW